MNRRREEAYNPNATQELRQAGGSTDKHRLEDLRWQAIANQDAGIKDLLARMAVLETTLKNLNWLIGLLLAVAGLYAAFHH